MTDFNLIYFNLILFNLIWILWDDNLDWVLLIKLVIPSKHNSSYIIDLCWKTEKDWNLPFLLGILGLIPFLTSPLYRIWSEQLRRSLSLPRKQWRPATLPNKTTLQLLETWAAKLSLTCWTRVRVLLSTQRVRPWNSRFETKISI